MVRFFKPSIPSIWRKTAQARQPIWQLGTGVHWIASPSKRQDEAIRQQQGTQGTKSSHFQNKDGILAQKKGEAEILTDAKNFDPKALVVHCMGWFTCTICCDTRSKLKTIKNHGFYKIGSLNGWKQNWYIRSVHWEVQPACCVPGLCHLSLPSLVGMFSWRKSAVFFLWMEDVNTHVLGHPATPRCTFSLSVVSPIVARAYTTSSMQWTCGQTERNSNKIHNRLFNITLLDPKGDERNRKN